LLKAGSGSRTAALSRGHTIQISPAGLLTITGGKWSTYRVMAQECVDLAAQTASLESKPSVTHQLKLHGYHEDPDSLGGLAVYGSDAQAIHELCAENPAYQQRLHLRLPILAAEVIWAVRHEMARTLTDVLARRTRSLFLDANASIEMAPAVANLMAQELGRDSAWQDAQIKAFTQLAQGYRIR